MSLLPSNQLACRTNIFYTRFSNKSRLLKQTQIRQRGLGTQYMLSLARISSKLNCRYKWPPPSRHNFQNLGHSELQAFMRDFEFVK